MGTPSFSFVPILFPFRLFPIVEKRREGGFSGRLFLQQEIWGREKRRMEIEERSICVKFHSSKFVRLKVELKSGKIFSRVRWIISSSVWIIEIRRNRRYLEVNQIYILTGFSIFSSFRESRLWFWGRKVSWVQREMFEFREKKKDPLLRD